MQELGKKNQENNGRKLVDGSSTIVGVAVRGNMGRKLEEKRLKKN